MWLVKWCPHAEPWFDTLNGLKLFQILPHWVRRHEVPVAKDFIVGPEQLSLLPAVTARQHMDASACPVDWTRVPSPPPLPTTCRKREGGSLCSQNTPGQNLDQRNGCYYLEIPRIATDRTQDHSHPYLDWGRPLPPGGTNGSAQDVNRFGSRGSGC